MMLITSDSSLSARANIQALQRVQRLIDMSQVCRGGESKQSKLNAQMRARHRELLAPRASSWGFGDPRTLSIVPEVAAVG